MISICIPYYPMKNHAFFLKRCIDSIVSQTYTDYEIVITQEGKSAENTNRAIEKARGEFIKILHMDDYFSHDHSLQNIVDSMTEDVIWLATGCSNNLIPHWTGDIHLGNNKIGAPSVITLRKGKHEWFDESMEWLFDCDFYKKMEIKYGQPSLMQGDNVTIQEGDHQATHLLSNEKKQDELFLMRQRYV